MPALVLEVRLHRREIDRDLASGIAAWRSPAHAARVAQLTSARRRRRLADALDHVVWAATLPPPLQAHSAIPPCRASIEAAVGQIRWLSERLRSNAPVAAAGIIRLEALLSDGAGPVYAPGRSDALDEALTVTRRWLDPEE
jgi:hypothetical protein